MRIQNEDGSWGPKAVEFGGRLYEQSGITGIALLVFLELGYSYRSRDELEGKPIADVVVGGLNWLVEHLSTTDLGRLQSTLALLDAYGLMGEVLSPRPKAYKEAAVRGLREVLARQATDGSWGSDLGITAWAARVLHFAMLYGIPLQAESWQRLSSYLKTRFQAHHEPLVAALLLMMECTIEKRDHFQMILDSPPDVEQGDYNYAHVAALVLRRDEGARNSRVMRGTNFGPWFDRMKHTIGADVRARWSEPGVPAMIRRLMCIHAATALCW